MSKKKNGLSRRAFVQAASVGVGAMAFLPKAKAATAAPCHVGFHFPTYTVQDIPVLTQAMPGNMAAVAPEHGISINYYKSVSYKVGESNKENRYLLCVDVGMAGAAGVFHPVEANIPSSRNTITDIYVFNQADNALLFWRKLGPLDVSPSAMFIVSDALKTLAPKITVVARCSAHGYWGQDFDMATAPTPYANAGIVGTHDNSKLYGGATLARPYTSATDPDVSKAATGGQGDLGVLHRPNIIVKSDTRVEAFLGGPIDGSGKHPRFADNHYINGGTLFDQNGNVLGKTEVILYLEASTAATVFTGFNLKNEGVKTLRVVINDTMQGRLMGFLDI